MGMGIARGFSAAGSGLSELIDRMAAIQASGRQREQQDFQNQLALTGAREDARHTRVSEGQGARGLDIQEGHLDLANDRFGFEKESTEYDRSRSNFLGGLEGGPDGWSYDRNKDVGFSNERDLRAMPTYGDRLREQDMARSNELQDIMLSYMDRDPNEVGSIFDSRHPRARVMGPYSGQRSGGYTGGLPHDVARGAAYQGALQGYSDRRRADSFGGSSSILDKIMGDLDTGIRNDTGPAAPAGTDLSKLSDEELERLAR